MKEQYQSAEMEVVTFDSEEIINTSAAYGCIDGELYTPPPLVPTPCGEWILD